MMVIRVILPMVMLVPDIGLKATHVSMLAVLTE